MKYISKLQPAFRSAEGDLLLITEEDEFVSTNPEGCMEAINRSLNSPENFEEFMSALTLSGMIEAKSGIKKIFIFLKDESEDN